MTEPGVRPWRTARELRHGRSRAPQEIKVRSDKLDGMLLELDVSETHVWVFRVATVVHARSHHERWDWGGYPQGLCDRAIPSLARIVAIADCFDALTSDRPCRSALPTATAIEAISDERRLSFDPRLVDQFLKTHPELEAIEHVHADPP